MRPTDLHHELAERRVMRTKLESRFQRRNALGWMAGVHKGETQGVVGARQARIELDRFIEVRNGLLMSFGDRIEIEMLDAGGETIFGKIDQVVTQYQPPG